MKKTIVERFPFGTAVAGALICTIFTALGSAAAQILNADEWKTYLIMTLALFLSVLIALLLVFKKRAAYGLRAPEHIGGRIALLCIPLLLMEILPIAFCGFRPELDIQRFAIIALFTLFVGLNEELWFRGIALRALSAKGLRYAILLTALLFGLLHSASLLGNPNAFIGGQAIATTVLQIVFAFGVGIALAIIALLTKSLLIPIIWHFAHDFIAISTNTRGIFEANSELITTALQLVLLAISALGLWIVFTKMHKSEGSGSA